MLMYMCIPCSFFPSNCYVLLKEIDCDRINCYNNLVCANGSMVYTSINKYLFS